MRPFQQLVLVGGLLTLAACGSAPEAPSATAPASSTSTLTLAPGLTGQASAGTLTVGQTRQLNVLVGGRAPLPGELTWTTSNAGVATVSQSGLVTARGAGNATIRAALTNNRSAFLDFTLSVTAATGTPAPTPTPAPSPSSSAFAQQVLTLTNQARAQARSCGATSFAATTPLTSSAQLEQAAQGHAADMAAKNYFSHTSQDGRTMAQRITATGYSWRTIGENIAAGQPTPESVVAGWLASEGHCRNIMNPSFKELGVGYAQGGAYGSYWVQDFGAR
ncbi:Allergen V5/Tpx-1 related [Deinococcus phoenicis]|uniref:Allergen V5/Tpx-1 related n=1 Tax=Deinococcus phoenicis TaxID=1476583 RepID=A0A016QRY6_9DEIO|nr:CAP domain-containing protein [Deinococcus phoenicis]EYB68751.1 Allergen V5/Tpx-1 related [Deinococcus phoenicis]